MLFDSHCHFTDEGFDGCRAELAEAIRGSQLRFIADIGTDYDTSVAAVRAAQDYEFCYAVVGWHPSEVGRLTEEQLARTLALLEQPKAVAIGEIGLDYHWEDNPPRDVQQFWFRRQLQEALRLGRPVCIHSRDADGDTFDILREEVFSKAGAPGTAQNSGAPGAGQNSDATGADPQKDCTAISSAKVLLHCYSGSAEMAKQYVKLGAKISIAGPVTYKNARKTVEVVKALDLKDLLIETDSPYLAPVPMRGKQNTPLYVEYVARRIAEIKGVSYEEVAEATFRNACQFYGISMA